MSLNPGFATPVLPRRSVRRGSLADRLASGTIIVVLALLVLPPLATLLYMGLTVDLPGSAGVVFSLDNLKSMFGDGRFYISAVNSLIFSLLTTAFCIAFGGIVAWIVVRTNAWFGRLAYVTAVLSLGTPYLLHVMAWLFFLGHSGPVNEAYRAITHGNGDLLNVFSLWGMVLIQGMLWSPLVFLLLSATFQRANAEMEEAARMSGGSVIRTVWAISFRLAWPAIVGMALFVFIRNLESFDVPVLVGGPGRVYLLTTDIYLSMRMMPPQMGHASALSLVLIALLAVVLVFYSRYSRNADRYATVTGRGYRPRPFDLGRFRWVGSAFILLYFVLALALPLCVSLWLALMPYAQPLHFSALRHLTLDNFSLVLQDRQLIDLAVNTIIVAAGAATAAVVIAVAAGWLVVRHRPGHRVIEQLSTIPIVYPGIVVGVALIIIALRLPIPLYGTLTIIVLAFLIRFLPYGMRYAHTGVLQIHRELEEAATASGASQWMTVRRIVLPLLLPALASGWVFIFLLGANELSMSVLLAGSQSQVMAVAMFDRWSSGENVEVFALGLVWSAFIALAMVVVYFVGRRYISIEQTEL